MVEERNRRARESASMKKKDWNRTNLVRFFDPVEFVVRHPATDLYGPSIYVGCFLRGMTNLEDKAVVPYSTKSTDGFSIALDLHAVSDARSAIHLLRDLKPGVYGDEGFFVRPRSVEIVLAKERTRGGGTRGCRRTSRQRSTPRSQRLFDRLTGQ